MMTSNIAKRSVVIGGHKTSVSLEDAFWAELKAIAHQRDESLSRLIARIDYARERGNLSSAIRLFVLDRYRPQVNPDLPSAENEFEKAAA
jgi:predicted DNA-binding ribbon-helix-helix protein